MAGQYRIYYAVVDSPSIRKCLPYVLFLAFFGMWITLAVLNPDAFAETKFQMTDSLFFGVDTARLRKSILQLESYGNRSDWSRQWETASWIIEDLAQYGIDAAIEVYDWNSKSWPNVIARIDGEDSLAAAVLFLAHFDSTTRANDGQAPGADDNGSGVAILLEVARLMNDTHPKRPVLFCFFSNEEKGSRGSRAFVQKSRENGFGIHCAINVDTVGYRPSGIFSAADALMVNAGFKYKLKAANRIAWNAVQVLFRSHESVKIVGPEAHRQLVDWTSTALERSGGVGVTRRYDDGCG